MDYVIQMFLVLIVWAFAFALGGRLEEREWRRELISRDLAYYDPKTREFKFKEKGQ